MRYQVNFYAMLSLLFVTIGVAKAEPQYARGPTLAPLTAAPLERFARHQTLCPGTTVRIRAADELEQDLGCIAAEMALARLGECSILPRKPLSIEVSDAVHDPAGNSLYGMLDVRREVVLVTALNGLEKMVQGTPYRSLPLSAFYSSLIVHEVVHAVMEQNYHRRPTSRAAYEYPAYAIQMELLAPDHREKLLQGELSKLDHKILFNDMILAFDPTVFGALAYRHFTGDENPCGRLQALLRGDVDFIVALPE